MAIQRYAAVSLPSSDGVVVRLPVSAAMARRLCFWILAHPENGATTVGSSTSENQFRDPLETSPWMLLDPSVLLWTIRRSSDIAKDVAQLQDWLPSVLSELLADISACELDSELVDRHCHRFLGAKPCGADAKALSVVGLNELDDFLRQIRPWVTLGEAGSDVAELNGTAKFAVEWSPAWDVDRSWHDMLLAQLLHGQNVTGAGCMKRPERVEPELSEIEFAAKLQQEKLLAMKQLAYGASHEINNPLANIATRAQTLLMDETDPKRRRTLATINQQAFRAHEMIADMMLFAMPPKMELSEVSLNDLVAEAVATVSELVEENSVSVETDLPTEISVTADETQLLVAVRCLLQNAIEAMPDGGTLSIKLRTGVNDSNDGPSEVSSDHDIQAVNRSTAGGGLNCQRGGLVAELTIEDDGLGLSDEARRHLFDPFFSGREAGRGLGFGLSKAWRIVTELGGRVEVTSRTLGENADDAESVEKPGATFTMRLPLLKINQPIP